MKKKGIYVISVLALAALLLAGCGNQSYIGAAAAKEAALEAAGITADQASSVTADLDTDDGRDYYEIEIVINGEDYEYDIDAQTGEVLYTDWPGTSALTGTAAAAQTDTAQAEATAVQADAAPPTATEAAVTASVTDTTASADASASTTAALTLEEAKTIALTDADYGADEVTFTKAKLDNDDGRQVYDVEFRLSTGAAYDYEIDASTGAILSIDYDGVIDSTGAAVTIEEAQALALSRVAGATESDLRIEQEYDDGRLQYEGTIIYNGVEYDFEIDASTGTILNWEQDNIG